MAVSTLKAACGLNVVAMLALALSTWHAMAAAHVEQQAISLDAQSSELDYKNNNLVFRKVRIAQGNMSQAAKLLGVSRSTLYGRLESAGRSGAKLASPDTGAT